MAQVTYPGVYIEEISSGVHTIVGVSTSIAAFFGRASKGPLDRAVRITSPSDYERIFGAPHPLSDLATSVQQFFDNGGTDCYVVRLAAGALTSRIVLQNLDKSHHVLVVTAKAAGMWGDGVRLEIDYNTPNPDESFNVRIVQEDGGVAVVTESFTGLVMDPDSPRFAPTFLTQSSQLIDVKWHSDLGADPLLPTDAIFTASPAGFSQSRLVLDVGAGLATTRVLLNNLFQGFGHFEISVNDSRYVDVDLSALDFTLVTVPGLPGLIQAEINNKIGAELPGVTVACTLDVVGANLRVLRLTPTSGRTSSVRVRRARALDMAADLLLGVDQGGIEVVRFSNQRPVFNGVAFMGGSAFGDIAAGPNGVNALATTVQDPLFGIGSIAVDTTTTVAVPGVKTVATVGSQWFEDASGGSDGVREKLRIVATTLNGDATFSLNYEAKLWGYHLAIVRKKPSNTVTTVASAPVGFLGAGTIGNVSRYTLGTSGTSNFQDTALSVAGFDGNVPGVPEYLGSALLRTGFHALDGVDLFNLMVLPGDRGVTEAIYQQLIGPASDYCATRRAMLLIDAPPSWTVNNLPVATDIQVNALRGVVNKENSALFYPRVQYSDRGVQKYIGPSGMVAGIMARTDATRGVWKAPAGLDATLHDAIDLEAILTDRQNGIFNPLAVNVLRKFPSGMVVWGSRTLAGFDNGSADWKYIPVRRTALFLEESLYRGTQWVVFEPNDDPLYASIRMNLTAFMMGLFRQGAFQGSTPTQAFFVKCDGETTTQNDRNLGIVNILVGFAPLKPAEFVVIKIQQIAGNLV